MIPMCNTTGQKLMSLRWTPSSWMSTSHNWGRATNARLSKNSPILRKTSQCLYCKLTHTFQIWVPEKMQYEAVQYFGHQMRRADSLGTPWCWERLRAGGEGDDITNSKDMSLSKVRGLMVRGVLLSTRSQRVWHYWVPELSWTED